MKFHILQKARVSQSQQAAQELAGAYEMPPTRLQSLVFGAKVLNLQDLYLAKRIVTSPVNVVVGTIVAVA